MMRKGIESIVNELTTIFFITQVQPETTHLFRFSTQL
jgi:hypothetical protein